MLLNSDFSQRAIITPEDHQWVTSPQPGVERVMLDRIGREKARATSLVRYAPNSQFPEHSHPGGEEILVLSGTFTENGTDYPAGWYLRSPEGSSHEPSSLEGTTIFVKLRQMAADDRQSIRINTRDAANWQGLPQRQCCHLFTSAMESVMLQKLTSGEQFCCHSFTGGVEILILEGLLVTHEKSYEPGSWLRLPPGDTSVLTAAETGALFYLKTGHLSPATLVGVKL